MVQLTLTLTLNTIIMVLQQAVDNSNQHPTPGGTPWGRLLNGPVEPRDEMEKNQDDPRGHDGRKVWVAPPVSGSPRRGEVVADAQGNTRWVAVEGESNLQCLNTERLRARE